MRWAPRFRKARARLALSGALLSALFLGLLALGARTLVRGMTFADIDEELYTLSAALGSSFELEGLEESKRDTLKAGLEANAFEFRLANHSAIVFKGDVPIAASGDMSSVVRQAFMAPRVRKCRVKARVSIPCTPGISHFRKYSLRDISDRQLLAISLSSSITNPRT